MVLSGVRLGRLRVCMKGGSFDSSYVLKEDVAEDMAWWLGQRWITVKILNMVVEKPDR